MRRIYAQSRSICQNTDVLLDALARDIRLREMLETVKDRLERETCTSLSFSLRSIFANAI